MTEPPAPLLPQATVDEDAGDEEEFDDVETASNDSFPASDAPGWWAGRD